LADFIVRQTEQAWLLFEIVANMLTQFPCRRAKAIAEEKSSNGDCAAIGLAVLR
jgi:hypothetical protein